MGGEYPCTAALRNSIAGSSPRGRGIRKCKILTKIITRFIPAWAGNTASCFHFGHVDTVHPRVGGEYSCSSTHPLKSAGSSPRGRGIQGICAGRGILIRFIPAWAGNTILSTRIYLALSVHPRVGGEYFSGHFFKLSPNGSSPRGRGIPLISTGL